jgi:oligopeptide transport system substrate-binding protein
VRTTTKMWNVALALVFALGLTFTGSAVTSAHPAKKATTAGLQTLRMGYLIRDPQLAPDLDPAFITDTDSEDIVQLIYGNLVQLLPNGKLVGDLAQKWTVSKNRKVYVFTLRSKARFSDGKKVTAQDVVYSIERSLSPAFSASGVQSYLKDIVGFDAYNTGKAKHLTGLKAVNASTVRFTLDKPIAYFLLTLSYPISDVVEKSRVNGKTPETFLKNTCSANMGTGPFKFVCQNKSSDPTSFYPSGSTPTYTLVPNSDFYGKPAHVKLVIPGIADDQTGYNDYKAGGIDEARVPTGFVAGSKGKKGFVAVHSSGVEYLALNFDSAPFNNIHCRLAVAYALDRSTMATKVWHGTTFPLYSMLPKGMLGWYNGKDNPHYSLTKAKAELAQCPGGINVDFYYRHDSVDHDAEAAAIQGMMQAAGITFNLKGITRADWLKLVVGKPLEANNVKVVWDDWFQDYPDPQDYCDYLLRSHSPQNVSDFNNSTYDHLVDQGNVEPNRTKRAQFYIKAQHLALSQVAWVTMVNIGFFFQVKPTVHGLYGDYSLATVWPKNNDWSTVSIGK